VAFLEVELVSGVVGVTGAREFADGVAVVLSGVVDVACVCICPGTANGIEARTTVEDSKSIAVAARNRRVSGGVEKSQIISLKAWYEWLK
jgi:hypothetical protein